jgi:cobalt-precorrin-5B (C1)-methyltransferase
LTATVADAFAEGEEGWAEVVKDAGDDPDVTDGVRISSAVRLTHGAGGAEAVILGGEGVGVVTRPGLPLPVGEPAINPVPRDMIRQAIFQAFSDAGLPPQAVTATISAADGENLAKRTLNPRLGIVGGLSILGTTGLVKPFSHEAYTATIDSGLSVAAAAGLDEVVLTTGGKSEKIAMGLRPDLPETAFIQMADFFGYSLSAIGEHDFRRVGVVSFFGKAVKQAQGLDCTHAHRAPMDLSAPANWLAAAGAAPDLVGRVRQANTARHALEIIRAADALDLTAAVGEHLARAVKSRLAPEVAVWVRIIDYDATVLYGRDLEGAA